jgi:hypothetical protein
MSHRAAREDRPFRLYVQLGADRAWINAFAHRAQAEESKRRLEERYKARTRAAAKPIFTIYEHPMRSTIKWHDMRARLEEFRSSIFVGAVRDTSNDAALIAKFLEEKGARVLQPALAAGAVMSMGNGRPMPKHMARAARRIGR